MKSKRFAVLFVMVGFLAVSGPAFAHHYTNSLFDMKKLITISGTVKEFRWMNPHSLLVINVKEQDTVTEWRASFSAPSKYGRSPFFWTRNTFQPGDQISLTGHPAKDPKGANTMWPTKLTRADGKVDVVADSGEY